MSAHRPRFGVQARFLLVVLLGVLVPLGLVGSWLAQSGRRSAEAMLRRQLDNALADAATETGHRWITLRGRLLTFGEHPAVVTVLGADAEASEAAITAALRGPWAALRDVVDVATFRTTDETIVARLDRRTPTVEVNALGSVPLRLPLHDRRGARIGAMDVQLRLAALLPPAFQSMGLDRISAVLDPAGIPLVPLNMDASLLLRPRFTWIGEDWMAAQRRISEPSLVLTLAAPIGPASLPFAEAARRGLWALLLVSLGGFGFALLLTRRITRPLERLADAADAVARGELDGRVREDGPAEIGRLGAAFNTMTASLQGTMRRLSQQEAAAAIGGFAASLAHEVRNPLTAVRLDLERAREGTAADAASAPLLERALQQLERLDATVSGSLRIARSGNVQLAPLDLRDPIRSATMSATPAFVSRGARLELDLPQDALMVRGNAAALEQLFLNLLLNAADALAEGGAACIKAQRMDSGVEVSVRDNGIGIAADAMARIFEPFFTTREEGTGLGLTIVRRIAEAHAAELQVESEVGLGSSVRLTMPHSVTLARLSGTFRDNAR
jgi:signal transduction histidine kinase